MAVVLVVLITIAADLVALARHPPSTWVDARSRNRLIMLLGGVALAAGSAQLLIRAPKESLPGRVSQRWTSSAITALAALLILALYPERLLQGTSACDAFSLQAKMN